MPRITVTTDTLAAKGERAVLLDEEVRSIHLESGHAAAQLIERLAWAILDAEETETPHRDSLSHAQASAPIVHAPGTRVALRLR